MLGKSRELFKAAQPRSNEMEVFLQHKHTHSRQDKRGVVVVAVVVVERREGGEEGGTGGE